MNLPTVFSLIQGRSYVIMLEKFWQVLPVLIGFIGGIVWLILLAYRRRQS